MTHLEISIKQLHALERDGSITVGETRIVLQQDQHFAKGKDIKACWDAMPREIYLDDMGLDPQNERGDWLLEDDKLYDLRDLGFTGWQGDDREPENMPRTFEDLYNQWKAKQS